MIWSDFEFVIHLACIIKPRILDFIWPCLLIIMIITWLFSVILFICSLIPEKSHVIPLFILYIAHRSSGCFFIHFFVDETWLSAKTFVLSDLWGIQFHTRSNVGIMAGNPKVPFLSPALLFFVLVFVWLLSLRNIHVSLSGRRHPCLFQPAGFCKYFFLIFIYIYRSPSDLMGPWHLLIGNALASSQYKLNKLQCHLQIIYGDILQIQMLK